MLLGQNFDLRYPRAESAYYFAKVYSLGDDIPTLPEEPAAAEMVKGDGK